MIYSYFWLRVQQKRYDRYVRRYRKIFGEGTKKVSMTLAGFEPAPMKTTALTLRLRPLGHNVTVKENRFCLHESWNEQDNQARRVCSQRASTKEFETHSTVHWSSYIAEALTLSRRPIAGVQRGPWFPRREPCPPALLCPTLPQCGTLAFTLAQRQPLPKSRLILKTPR